MRSSGGPAGRLPTNSVRLSLSLSDSRSGAPTEPLMVPALHVLGLVSAPDSRKSRCRRRRRFVSSAPASSCSLSSYLFTNAACSSSWRP